MSLIPCPSCGKNISDKARKCPNCGFERAETTSSSDPEPPSAGAPKLQPELASAASGVQPEAAPSPAVAGVNPASRVEASPVNPKFPRSAIFALVVLGCLAGVFFIYRVLTPKSLPVQPPAPIQQVAQPVVDPHAGQYYDKVTRQWSDNRPDDGRYPQTRTRKLVAADVEGLTVSELRIMRNEIFARHGYAFQTDDMRAYFGRQPWYTSRSRSVSLSPVEQYNVQFIKRYE